MSNDPRLDVLCAELERLFDLEELHTLARGLLGLDPTAVGGASNKASFAKALTRRCDEDDAIEALVDAMTSSKKELDPRLATIRLQGFAHDEQLAPGASLGPHLVLRKLGEGRVGSSYVVRGPHGDRRLKVLRRQASFDRAAVQRFFTANRRLSLLQHPGLPQALSVETHGGRACLLHDHVEGPSLASRLAKRGAVHFGEAAALLTGIVTALAELHAHGLVHGGLRMENIVAPTLEDETESPVLLDAGAYHLRVPAAPRPGQADPLASLGSPKTLSPEQIQGHPPDARSDLYSFGAVVYELLTGEPPFRGSSAEALAGHLSVDPEPPSLIAPAGWISPELDELVLKLLSKNPDNRPVSAEVVLERVESLTGRNSVVDRLIDEADLASRIEEVMSRPWDTRAAESLEESIREGADPTLVADTFRDTAYRLDPTEGRATLQAYCRLLLRAAHVYEGPAKLPERAIALYRNVLEADPHDRDAANALLRTRRALGRHEEVVEELLERCESAEGGRERAHLLTEIGKIYAGDMGDNEQALVAFTQAFCEDPLEASCADEIEELAGSNLEAWNDVMTSCMEAAQGDLPQETQHALLSRMGRWYQNQIQRPDLALPCFTAILATDPTHERALEGVTTIYRQLGRWMELGQTLMLRAASPATHPPQARELLAEAAQLLETRLGQPASAKELYDKILAEDPSHETAAHSLASMHERIGDFQGMVQVLEKHAAALEGAPLRKALQRIGETYEMRLGQPEEAMRRYERIVADEPTNADALHALERTYARLGRSAELIRTLERQVEIAATPRQRLSLWERIAGIWDRDFLDHQRAAEAWENVIDLEPNHDAALTHLARHYRALERWDDVVLVCDRHAELLTGEPERRIEQLLLSASVLGEKLHLPERAIQGYEQVLELDPNNAPALEALAKLRTAEDDTEAALSAMVRLAKTAETPAARAEHYLRAARFLEEQGDPDRAFDHYKLALEANPDDRSLSSTLRAAYVRRGDARAAAELLKREIEQTEGEAARAKLAGEMAALCHDRLHDVARAESYAKLALEADPTSLDALRVLGELAFEAGRHLEARKHLEQVANRTEGLPPELASEVLETYLRSLEKTDAAKQGLKAAERLLEVAPDDPQVLRRVAAFMFDHGEAARARDLYDDLVDTLAPSASVSERAMLLYRYGEAARRTGLLDHAREALEAAADLDPAAHEPLESLVSLHKSREAWREVVSTMYRLLETVTGPDRIKLMTEIGDIAAEKLDDVDYAAKSYLYALGEKPDDRRILTKLMQLYSKEKDWSRLIQVILRLAEFVDNDQQRAKYLHTAAAVAWRELRDAQQASRLMQRALELDPDQPEVLKSGMEVHRVAGNAEAMKELLKRQAKLASDTKDTPALLAALTELADVYLARLGKLDQAIAVLQAAVDVEPNNQQRLEVLGQLYLQDSPRYAKEIVELQQKLLGRDPFRPDAFQTLRRVFTEEKNPDGAWCCCQALVVLQQASHDEARFYERMRSEEGAVAQSRLTQDSFHRLLLHPDAEPLVTALTTLLQPVLLEARGVNARKAGFGPDDIIDPQRHHFSIAQAIPYCAEVLGIAAPPMLQDEEEYGELAFLHTSPPAIVLGTAVVGVALPIQSAYFMAARHLVFYQPGLYMRQLVPTSTGLKAWVFAAIKLVAPAFPIPGDLAAPVQEAIATLTRFLDPTMREHLLRIVTKLLQSSPSLDLRKWTGAIDYTADRAGLLLCDDLQTAVDLIRSSARGSSVLGSEQRVEEIFRFAASVPYLELRRTLGIAIDM